MTRDDIDHRPTRRTLLRSATALAGLAALPRGVLGATPPSPNSVFGGVHVGTNTYSYRGERETAEDTLKALLEDGLSEVELKAATIRSYLGMPPAARSGAKPSRPSDARRQAYLARAAELRAMYNGNGVNIHIHKLEFGPTDEDIDFNFEVAKVLGCKAITTERNDALAKRLAPFAEKHRIWVAFHNHTENTPAIDAVDPLTRAGDFIGFNFDIGHYVAGTKGKSPIPVLEKYHAKIVSLHLKDRTAAGGNLPWGRGETPIKEVLRLLKREKWPIYADIELEYPIPKGSTAVKEVAKCVAYCKEALA
ncbi:sugar phosphate isomerase/epimerase family protein [Aquisphaera insulae]|uniref:sugar phosphate isomerase/epimerase family protein n=1 Tax=Aquisphaera insulae TaxID=2712864 RepID=UPI0013EC7653|nr:TIM barrel protein [Aquisphaera insulae]